MMDLLDNARRIAATNPFSHHDGYCIYCLPGTGTLTDHGPGCPWLAMPVIIDVLERLMRLCPTPEDTLNDIAVALYGVPDGEGGLVSICAHAGLGEVLQEAVYLTRDINALISTVALYGDDGDDAEE